MIEQLNGLALAYIGDAYFELIVRNDAIQSGLTKVNDLHQYVTNYTKGQTQASFVDYLISSNLLSEDEMNSFKRGRNCHTNQNRKNVSLATYQHATGFESIIGTLYYQNNLSRIDELWTIMKGWKDERGRNDEENRKK